MHSDRVEVFLEGRDVSPLFSDFSSAPSGPLTIQDIDRAILAMEMMPFRPNTVVVSAKTLWDFNRYVLIMEVGNLVGRRKTQWPRRKHHARRALARQKAFELWRHEASGRP